MEHISQMPELNLFLTRLITMLNSPEVDTIRWSDDGNEVHISDKNELAGILEQFGFDTDTWSSFHRQMNQYGFKIVRSSAKRARPIRFRHELFSRDHPEFWASIERIKAKSKASLDKQKILELERDKDAWEQEKLEMERRMKQIARMLIRLRDPGITQAERRAVDEEWTELRPHIPLTPPTTSPAIGPIVKAEPLSPPGSGDFILYPAHSHMSPTSGPPHEAPRSPLVEDLMGALGLGSAPLTPDQAAAAADQLSEAMLSTLSFSDVVFDDLDHIFAVGK